MGSIDPLLGIVQLKKAAGVVLASDEVPALLENGVRSPLTMPPLTHEMMEGLVAEVLSPDERATLELGGTLDTAHASAAHGTYGVRAHRSGAKVTLTFTRGGPEAPRPPSGGAPTTAADDWLAPILEEALARGASDVLLSSGHRPLLRIDGDLLQLDSSPAIDDLRGALDAWLGTAKEQLFGTLGSVDFAVVHRRRKRPDDEVRFRANLFRHTGGTAVALRPIWTEIPGLAELNLPPTLVDLVEPRHGLILVSGATGSGKSTTLAALLEHLNRSRPCHIVTLEDPIEYVYPRRRAIIHQREVGLHVDGFASGLRAALRENPDALLVGEMRDAETIRLALTAALTGHLVLSTLHSGSAPMAVERIIDVFSESEKLHVRQELATALRYVVVQQLVAGSAGGRLPVLEVLTVNHAVAAQIRDGRTHMLGTQMEIGVGDGMVMMERALADLVRDGRISAATAFGAAANRELVRKLLGTR